MASFSDEGELTFSVHQKYKTPAETLAYVHLKPDQNQTEYKLHTVAWLLSAFIQTSITV